MAATSPKVGDKVKHIYRQLYPWKSKFELASHLCKSIFYSSDGVIALNKPFGVGLKIVTEEQHEKSSKIKPTNVLHTQGVGSTYTFEDTLPIMRDELKLPNLVVVKSAEKYHSGVTLLAENKAAAKRIQRSIIIAKPKSIFHSTFYIVSPYISMEGCNGVEFKEHVGITLQKNPQHKVSQPVIVRNFSRNSVKRGEIDPLHVEYIVKSTSPNKSSLVELKCNTTKMNLLRIYCADMLMPILGDHLYSSRVILIKGNPSHLHPLHLKPGSSHQKLPQKILEALELKEVEGTSMIPLHVHLRNKTLVDFHGRGQHLNLTAPFSDIFRWTCDALQLTLPDNVT